MEKLREWIPAISSTATIIFVLLGGSFAYGKLNQKVAGIEDDLEDERLNLSAAVIKREEDMRKLESDIKEDMERMEAEHIRDTYNLNAKIDKMDDKNSKQHQKLFDLSNSTNTMVAEMSGYLLAKKEKK